MSCYQISKQELASPGSTKMVGGVLPLSSDSTYLLREESGRGQLTNWFNLPFVDTLNALMLLVVANLGFMVLGPGLAMLRQTYDQVWPCCAKHMARFGHAAPNIWPGLVYIYPISIGQAIKRQNSGEAISGVEYIDISWILLTDLLWCWKSIQRPCFSAFSPGNRKRIVIRAFSKCWSLFYRSLDFYVIVWRSLANPGPCAIKRTHSLIPLSLEYPRAFLEDRSTFVFRLEEDL
ncbi:hypothetical protein AVEN_199217-1 [Araneus ventricosus]|uniref:Uncharacterized protein n=1 Tax=Araneus ventricosus TaxID=182803 RepID=A0A4Y2U109_ARAVE|nr:hypothetical protein AVEN_199217-1 [Araneus ventricosus]